LAKEVAKIGGSLGKGGGEDWRAGKWGMDTPVAYAEKLRPRHHAKKNPLLGTLAINQNINPKGLSLITPKRRRSRKRRR
jgi:hypothetical protein